VRTTSGIFLWCGVFCLWVFAGDSRAAESFTVQAPGVAGTDAVRFGVHEIRLTTGDGSVANPHDTDFRVTFTPPSGVPLTVDGFYDGGTDWAARVYVTETGIWTWSTSSSDDPGLDNHTGSFSAVASTLRGKLRKHPQNNQRWATEDGRFFLAIGDTPYLLFNDECSTHFNPSCSEDLFHRYIQQIVTKGVSLLRVGYGGGYSGWNPDQRASDGRYPRANWIHDGWDYSGFDMSQLQKSDQRLAWLLDNYPDIYIDLHLLPKINDTGDAWFQELTEAQRNRTLKVLLARLAAFPNVMFLIERDFRHTYSPLDKLTQNGPNLEMCRSVGTYLAQHDPWDTLRGCNEKSREYNQLTLPSDFDTWASYLEVQHWGYPHATAVDWYYDNVAYLPAHVFLGEDVYEYPWSGTPLNPAYYYRRLLWSALLSGGSGTYGALYKSLIPYDESGTTDYWAQGGLADPYRLQLTGLDEAIHVREFFEQRDIDLAAFRPDDGLARLQDSVAPGGNDGPGRVQAAHDGNSRYIFYHPNAADGEQESPDITLETGDLVESRYNGSLRFGRTPGIIADLRAGVGRSYEVEWFHPVTGQSFPAGSVSGGSPVSLTAPAAFSGSDAVLYLRALPTPEPPPPAFITAHRGGGEGADGWAPENTLAAFRKCLDNGVNIETDLNYTSDGAIILLHGGNLATTTDGSGAPTSRSLSYVQTLDAAAHNGWDAEYSPQPVLTFEALLDEFSTAAQPGTLIVADAHRLKPDPSMDVKLLQAIEQRSLFHRVYIQVFDLEHAEALRSAAEALYGNYQMLNLAIWVADDEVLFDQAVQSGYFVRIDAGSTLTPRAASLPASIQFVSRADAHWDQAGVDGIITDFVDQGMLTIDDSIPQAVFRQPADFAQISSGPIAFAVDYGDSDSSIERIELWQGTTLLQSDTTPPYTYSWVPPSAGTWSLTARVFDNGKSLVSAPLTVAWGDVCLNYDAGDVTLDSGDVLTIGIGGTTPCTEHGRINVSNTLTLNEPTLELVLGGGFVPQYGDRFDVLDWGELVGSFGTVDSSGAGLPYPLIWNTGELHLSGEAFVDARPIADGDLAPWDNPDGQINAGDVLIATQLVLGERTPGVIQYAHGDMNSDGVINLADLLLIQQQVANQ